MNGVNLVPRQRKIARRRLRRVYVWLASCATYAIACLLAFAAARVISGGAGASLAAELANSSADIAKTAQVAAALKAELVDAESTLAIQQAVVNQPDWSVALAMLAELTGQDVVLADCRLAPLHEDSAKKDASATQDGPFVLLIQGFGQSQQAVSQFVLRLERAGLFDNVALLKTSREAFLEGHAINFQARCLLSGRGAGQ